MKIHALLFTLSLVSADPGPAFMRGRRGLMDQDVCEGKKDYCGCAVCKDYDADAGTVTIDVKSCGKTDVSWMCCAGTNGIDGKCAVEGAQEDDKPNKQEGTDEIKVYNITEGAKEVVLQIKDGNGGLDGGIPDGASGFCAGGQGDPECNDGLCETVIYLDDCDEVKFEADPHLKNWAGQWFDYHGECDLNLMTAPQFDGQQDLGIHARTRIQYQYSYIEAAAVAIGDDILEVGSWGEYAVNGVEDAIADHALPTIGGYPLYHRQVNKKKHVFDIVLDAHRNITVSNFKSWVNVNIKNAHRIPFPQVTGLMGTYEGKMLSHDGLDMSEDMNALGQDWQIKDGDAKLFRTLRAPQWPEKCRLPKVGAQASRKLGEGVTEEAAEMACAHKNGDERKFCIYDVIATQDLDMANAMGGAF